MRYPVTITLLLLVMLQTFSKMMVILGYEWNKEYIAKTLCVNRNRPRCHCHGKCYLNKKLAQEENTQSYPGESSRKDLSQLQFLPEHQKISVIATSPAWVAIQSGFYIDIKSGEFAYSIFQPPRA